MYQDGPKRCIDLLLGLSTLTVVALPILFSILIIKLTSPGPAFFFQARAGKNEQVFWIYKLRTMSVDPSRCGEVQVDRGDPGVFAFGSFLRRFKIDELPQILNVIKGDMSFVGPRPFIEEIRRDMPQWARKRYTVRPGLTGIAQTSGNASLSWEKRWEQDIQYVDQISFSLDTWLLLKTLLVIVLGEEKFEVGT